LSPTIVWMTTSTMVGPVGSASVRPVEQRAAIERQPGESTSPLAAVALIGGTGKLGSALAARFARAGHQVVIGSRDSARAVRAASALLNAIGGVDASRVRGLDNAAAADAADVVVITVPFDAQEATLRGLAGAVGERVVISTAVPVRFVEGAGPTHVEVEQGSASEQVAALLPRARVVGALHTLSSATLAKLDRDLDADVLITGDDSTAKMLVAGLLVSLPGIRVVDGGPLRNSRYVEHLTVLLLSINMRVRRNTGVRITNLPDDLALRSVPAAGGPTT
jgi:8-hydroxy-5-deazaflavin:NADPH oxidoreductase